MHMGLTELVFLGLVVVLVLWMQFRLVVGLSESKSKGHKEPLQFLRGGSLFAVGAILFLSAIQVIAIHSMLGMKSRSPIISFLIAAGISFVLVSVLFGVSQILLRRPKRH